MSTATLHPSSLSPQPSLRWHVVTVHAEKFFIQLGTQRVGIFTSAAWAQAHADKRNAELAAPASSSILNPQLSPA